MALAPQRTRSVTRCPRRTTRNLTNAMIRKPMYLPPYVTDESDELSISLDPSAVYDKRPGVPKTGEAAMKLRCKQEDKNSTLCQRAGQFK